EQIAVLLATTSGLLDDVPVNEIAAAEQSIREGFRQHCKQISKRITSGEKLSDEDREGILERARRSLGEG
ncbi:MAG: F0F1 ATP synthase subunit alpha, partial [Alphaproteobacteria bacterium]|nr:F0F1 ATP synthase subunit alpha [Alphaproteobacteria bacterium]